jgi:hypothetical protein
MNRVLTSCRGLKPGQLQQPKQVDPLWTLKQNSVAGPTLQRPPSAAVLASIPVLKEWPESAQVQNLPLFTKSHCITATVRSCCGSASLPLLVQLLASVFVTVM